VRFVGGCCGTTPDHVAALRAVVDEVQAAKAGQAGAAAGASRAARRRGASARAGERRDGRGTGAAAAQPVPLAERSAWGAKLARVQQVVSVEILPPHSWDATEVVAAARELAAAGVDAVSFVDTARSRIRMGALAAAAVVEREVGLETVVHYACRGKNMLSMLSELLGAAALGLRNILVVSGDPPALGPYPDATEVLDIDSIGLTHVVQGLNRGLDPGGASIGAPTRFVQGVAVNEGAQDRRRELERLAYKLEAGADFAITQPVFDVGELGPFLELAARHGTPVIAGVWPFPSLRSAEFLANEVPGVAVPPEIVERMRRADASSPEAALEEGLAIALEVIGAVRPARAGHPPERAAPERLPRAARAPGGGDRRLGIARRAPV
jgi:methionine synthase / methylenetetrahydrofolate reductase(NADPH)